MAKCVLRIPNTPTRTCGVDFGEIPFPKIEDFQLDELANLGKSKLANCLSFTVNITCVFHDEELFRQTTCVTPTLAISFHK
jgi:hypothetical protein